MLLLFLVRAFTPGSKQRSLDRSRPRAGDFEHYQGMPGLWRSGSGEPLDQVRMRSVALTIGHSFLSTENSRERGRPWTGMAPDLDNR
jgi:hypothetical protein